jgi:citrate lyase subunit beta / citryl-CoA lyase
MHRSRLFVPADDASLVAEAVASAADALILDLEDTVALDQKARARDLAVDVLRKYPERSLSVRVNGVDGRFIVEDLTTLVDAAGARLREVWLPKVEGPNQIAHVAWLLRTLESKAGLTPEHVSLFALVESASGLEELGAISRASSRLSQLAFGIADLSGDLSLGWPADGTEQLYVRSRLAVASRAAGLSRPMDSVWPRLADEDGLRADCLAAKTLGFAGKFALAPSQVETINEVFSPTPEEVRMATQTLEAFSDAERAGRGAVRLPNGEFVDYAFLRRAEETVESARRLGLLKV